MMNGGTPNRPSVVVGGGYGGVNVAKALDADTNVVLIEPKDALVHNIGALRALVDPAFLPKIFLPTVSSSSRARSPRPTTSFSQPGRRQASRVLLVGAGPVGIELAGEIHSTWPDKHITLLDFADDVLGDRFRPDLRAELRAQLTDIGDVSTADAKMAGMAGMQAQLTAQNILRMGNGERDLVPYEPYGPAIVVPIGPEGGSGQLPRQDEFASRDMVAAVKGRDLMVDRFAEIIGLSS